MNGNQIYVKIYAGDSIYDRLAISTTAINHYSSSEIHKTTSKVVHFYRLRLPGVTLHNLIKHLKECQRCRAIVMNYILGENNINRVRIHLMPLVENVDTIDYNWNEKCYHIARERCELDHTLSWLSTLGGAFSALGDYFTNCAETAAKISAHQFQLALRLGDPNIAARCRLYFALSLIQRKEFKLAQSLILNEYRTAISANEDVIDHRLIKMCQGIWAKLKYERSIHRKIYRG